MQDVVDKENTLLDYAHIAFQHRRKMFWTLCLCVAGSWLYGALEKPEYTAVAVIWLPSETTNSIEYSSSRAERQVVRTVYGYTVEGAKRSASLTDYWGDGSEEKAIKELQKRTRIFSGLQRSRISVAVTTQLPELSAAVANSYVALLFAHLLEKLEEELLWFERASYQSAAIRKYVSFIQQIELTQMKAQRLGAAAYAEFWHDFGGVYSIAVPPEAPDHQYQTTWRILFGLVLGVGLSVLLLFGVEFIRRIRTNKAVQE